MIDRHSSTRSCAAILVAASVLLSGCASSSEAVSLPGSAGDAEPLLRTTALAGAIPACDPGGNCCDPTCTYADVIDETVLVPTQLSSSSAGLALATRGASSCGQLVQAEDAPLAVFYAASRDQAMGSATDTCKATESRCTGSGNGRRCSDVCVAWKTRWDEVREGATDYVSSTALAGGTFGANSVQPLWRASSGSGCVQTCFLSFCTTDCSSAGGSQLDCDGLESAPPTAPFGVFTSWAPTFMGAWWAQDIAPVTGNPVDTSLQNALMRASEYQAANPTHTVAVNMIVDDYPSGCGDYLPIVALRAYLASHGSPRIQTNILGLGNVKAYTSIAQYTYGTGIYIDPATSVRANTAAALASLRTLSDKRQFLVAQPASGDVIDAASLRFTLRDATGDTELTRVASDDACGNRDGYWIDYPSGASGPIRVNLCRKTETRAQQRRSIGWARYDCLTNRSAEATYVRPVDFDLTACNAAGLEARVLRFDWVSTLPWNTYVRYRLQFAASQGDLGAAEPMDFVATSWGGNARGWGDLSLQTNPSRPRWARLTATLYASSDVAHSYSPTIASWGLSFTCVDAL